MAPRWKGEEAEAKLLQIQFQTVTELQSSLIQSDSHGILSGCSVLLAADKEQTSLLNHACFDQLSMEEAFYLCDIPKCLKILGEGNCTEDINQMWDYMVQPRHLLMQLLEARWNPE